MCEIPHNIGSLIAFMVLVVAFIALLIKSKKLRNSWRWIIGIIIGLLLIVLVFFYFYALQYTKVPNIVGKSVSDACRILAEKDLDFPNNFVANSQDTIRYQFPKKDEYVLKNG